jgi:hypothetical protein
LDRVHVVRVILLVSHLVRRGGRMFRAVRGRQERRLEKWVAFSGVLGLKYSKSILELSTSVAQLCNGFAELHRVFCKQSTQAMNQR